MSSHLLNHRALASSRGLNWAAAVSIGLCAGFWWAAVALMRAAL